MLAHHRATPSITDLPRGTHSHTWVERGTARVKTLLARSGVIFCAFLVYFRRKRGKRELRARRGALLPSHSTRTSSSPRFRLCSPEIRKKLRLFCRLRPCPRPQHNVLGQGLNPDPLIWSRALTKCEYHREVYPRERIPYKDDRLGQWIFRVAREVAHYSGWRVVLNVQFLLVKSLPVSIRVVHAHHVTHLLVSTTPR